MNDDPNMQALVDANRDADAAISDNAVPITVRTDKNEEAGPDFIEAPVESDEEKPAGKSINIVDQTPEAEDLINGVADNNETEITEEKVEPMNNIKPIAPVEQLESVAPVEQVEQVAPVEPVAPVMLSHNDEAAEINIDAEHAFEESNEDFFRTTREKIANLRKARNENIVSADKKEDELTTIERYNSQYEITGALDKIDRERVETLRNEIRDLRADADAKDKAIRASLKIIRTL